MDFRFVAYDPQTGTKLYQLPRANSVNIGDTFGTRGTLELTYSAKAVNARDLPTFLEVQAEVTFDEGHNWAPAGPSLLRLSGEHEDTDQAGMRTLRFVGREWVLGKARVGNGDLELIDGKRPFYRASPGQILRTLILEAQDRGAADGIEIGNFTAAKDSSGKAWAKVATIYYSPGLPIGSVLENLVEQGMCDYRMNGRTIELFDPETTMGRDLTTGSNPVRVHGAVTEAPVKYTLEDLANSALLMGDEGFELEVDNPTAPDDYGRLEVTIEQGGVSDSGTARLMVDEALHRGSREVREITRSQSAAGAAFLPFRDYRVGDYVQVHTGGEWERYRVREIQLARDGQEWTIHTVINDRLQELLLKLAKRTSGIVNGSKGSGGDGTRPTPPEKPGIEPAAPGGLVIDQQVYLDRQGIARGQVTAGWGAVTESTKGTAVEIGGYELWWRRNETQAVWTRAAVTDGSITVSHSPVVLTDAFGTAMEYQWRVRAIAEASTRPGPFSDVVTLTMTQDTEPPNVPSMPTVETDLRIVTVDWDGLDEFGEAMPVDYNHHRIYFAAAEDMAGAEQVGTLTQPGSWNSGSMTPDVPVWVAVSAVDHVGNESDMTPAQSVTPKKLVDDDSIRDELGTIDGKIDDAVRDLNDAIDNIVIDANGTTTYWMPTAPDETTDPQPKTGDLWFDTSTAGKNKLHRFDGASWVSAADERIDTIGQAQDDLEADVDRVRTSVDGKNAVIQSTSTPPSQYSGAEGDIWEIMSSMGSGGRSVSRWRWSGTVWVSNLIGDTVLGNVDAAKIGTGHLDAGRIAAGSITTDKMLIGVGGNVIPWDPSNSTNPHSPRYGATLEGIVDPDLGPAMLVKGGSPTDGSMLACLVLSSGSPIPGVSSSFELLPIEPGRKYRLNASMLTKGSLPAGSSLVRYEVHFSDGTGAYLGRVFSPNFTLPGAPTDVSLDLDPPASAAYIKIHVHKNFWSTGDLAVINPSVRIKSGVTLIEDGAITTDKIATGAITAESGVVESLDAGDITVGELSAARIGSKTITTDKLLIGATGNLIPWNISETTDPHAGQSGATLESTASSSGLPQLAVTGGAGTDGSFSPCLIVASGDAMAPDGVDQLNISVEGGRQYRLEAGAMTYFDPPAGVTAQARWKINVMDGQGTYLSQILSSPATLSWSSTRVGVDITVPPNGGYLRIHLEKNYWSSGSLKLETPELRPKASATLIEDGAITTDKILANAITAGKIAALAIEADHISANAITADKINAGAIDGKLITGARIRTAASGARVELNSEGLKAYRSNGAVVLNTDTSDGSIEMVGRLSQTIGGRTITLGGNYGGGPGIMWSDSNIYEYPPGIRYGNDFNNTSVMATLIQGPGMSDGSSYLNLMERGDEFDMRTWKGTGSSSEDWRVQASMADNRMRVGSSTSDAPYMYFKRGSGDTGQAYFAYRHPNGDGYSALTLKDSSASLYAYNWQGTRMGRLIMDAGSTELSAGTRSVILRGDKVGINSDNGIYLNDSRIHMNSIPNDSDAVGVGRIKGRLYSIYSSRRYKLLEEPIETTVESFEDKLLSVDAKTWIDKTRAERIADYHTAITNDEDPAEPLDEIGGLERIPGVIAEDLHDAGLEVFVRYDGNGEPQSVAYDRIGPALIPIIRRLRDRVDALETKLGENNAA